MVRWQPTHVFLLPEPFLSPLHVQSSQWVFEYNSLSSQDVGPQLPVRATLGFWQRAARQAIPASALSSFEPPANFYPLIVYRPLAAGWAIQFNSSFNAGVPQADLAINPATGLAHAAYLSLGGGATTGTPIHSTFDLSAQSGEVTVVQEVVASAAANDVAVAVDVDGVPLVAFTDSTGAFVYKRDGPGCWVAYATGGGQPPLPLNNGVAQAGRGVDLAVDAATRRVFVAVAAESVALLSFPSTPEPFFLRRVVLCSSVSRGPWACSEDGARKVDAGFVRVAATLPLAASAVSIALRPDGVPHVAATQTITTTAVTYLSFCFRYDPQTLIPTSLGLIRGTSLTCKLALRHLPLGGPCR
jgi:hypothetical protein